MTVLGFNKKILEPGVGSLPISQYLCSVAYYFLTKFCIPGTSTDVSRYAGEYEHVFETTTAGVTIQAPQVSKLSLILLQD